MKKLILVAVLAVCLLPGCRQKENKQGMESYQTISIDRLNRSAPALIRDGWMLITAGNPESFNTMTASWGSLGELWGLEVATVYIRPQRYTKEFVDREELFTLSFFTEEYRKALQICGTKSGRDTDKVKEAGLTPMQTPSGSMAFREAYMILECRKLYVDQFDPACFVDQTIAGKIYPTQDFHFRYIGEILNVYVK